MSSVPSLKSTVPLCPLPKRQLVLQLLLPPQTRSTLGLRTFPFHLDPLPFPLPVLRLRLLLLQLPFPLISLHHQDGPHRPVSPAHHFSLWP